MVRLGVLLLASLALAGCETFVEIDGGAHEPVLVVQGVFVTDAPWTLTVQRTVSLGDTTDVGGAGAPVSGATVTVTDDLGRAVVLPEAGDVGNGGVYGAGYDIVDGQLVPRSGPAPEAGRTYSLRVETAGFAPVTATSEAPPAPTDLAAEVLGGWEREGDFATDVRLGVRFLPAPGAPHEFTFVSGRPSGASADSCVFDSFGTFFTDAPVLREATFLDDLRTGSGSRRLLSTFLDLDAADRAPDGRIVFEILGENPGGCAVGVDVSAASAAYFEHIRSLARRRAAERNPFAEPVPSFSNIEGGTGIFAGRTTATAVVRRGE